MTRASIDDTYMMEKCFPGSELCIVNLSSVVDLQIIHTYVLHEMFIL